MSEGMMNTDGVNCGETVCNKNVHPLSAMQSGALTSAGQLTGVQYAEQKESMTFLNQIQTMGSSCDACLTPTALNTASTNIKDQEVRISSRNASRNGSFRQGSVGEKTFEEIMYDSDTESDNFSSSSSSDEEDDELPTEGHIVLSRPIQILKPPKSDNDDDQSSHDCSFEESSIPQMVKPIRQFCSHPLEVLEGDLQLAEIQSKCKEAAEPNSENQGKMAYYRLLISEAQRTLPEVSCENMQQYLTISEDFFGSIAKDSSNFFKVIVQAVSEEPKPYYCHPSKTDPKLIHILDSSSSFLSESVRFPSDPVSKRNHDAEPGLQKRHTFSFGLESPISVSPVNSRRTGP